NTAACATRPNLCLTLSRQHNALGQLMRTTDANGGRTDYWYTPQGQAAALRDANGQATLATYNSFGHRLRSEDPNQGIWNFVYDALGGLSRQTDARGVVTDRRTLRNRARHT
ncbi:MAG: RHS repeat protein, partial [Rhodanobacteraceae bacterium]|nr:RHS repeat protein [Rhodanobacteraceae bacterium]